MPNSEALGRAMAERRHELGMTQGDVAQRSGLSVSSVSGLERGQHHNVRTTTLQAIERALMWEEGTAALHYSGMATVRDAIRSFTKITPPRGSAYTELLRALARMTDDEIDDIASIINTRRQELLGHRNKTA